MERRDFVRLTGTAAGAIAVPIPGWRDGGSVGALTPIPAADKKALADVALNTGRARGATYVDVRIARYLNQFITARDTKVHWPRGSAPNRSSTTGPAATWRK